MGAPVFNTSFVGQGTRTAKNPMTSPQTGGLHDLMSKGKQIYGTASAVYGYYWMPWYYYDNGADYGGGVYVHIAATECMSHVYSYSEPGGVKSLAGAFAMFCFGVIAIGLVLLDHEHC